MKRSIVVAFLLVVLFSTFCFGQKTAHTFFHEIPVGVNPKLDVSFWKFQKRGQGVKVFSVDSVVLNLDYSQRPAKEFISYENDFVTDMEEMEDSAINAYWDNRNKDKEPLYVSPFLSINDVEELLYRHIFKGEKLLTEVGENVFVVEMMEIHAYEGIDGIWCVYCLGSFKYSNGWTENNRLFLKKYKPISN